MKIRKSKKPGIIVGLDLSLRAAAACALPTDWDGDLTKAKTEMFGGKLGSDATHRERTERMVKIAHDVSLFCLNAKATHVFVEAYAFGMRSTSSHQLAELGGAVKARLLDELDLAVEPIVASQARKTLLQKLPRADVKEFTELNVRSLGGPAPYWTGDECDAFCVVNHALSLVGGVPLSFLGKDLR